MKILTTRGDYLDARIGSDGGGGGGSHLTIHCRYISEPREECAYCERLAEYKIATGGVPEFAPVCPTHAGELLTVCGEMLLKFGLSESPSR